MVSRYQQKPTLNNWLGTTKFESLRTYAIFLRIVPQTVRLVFGMIRKRLERFKQTIEESRAATLNPATYEQTIDHLLRTGEISAQGQVALKRKFNEQLLESRYTLNHLGAHLGIGVVFAFDVVPLPLGTIGRVSWVVGARIVETVRRNFERARVHSFGVLVIAAIPWFGYAAYLLPLRRNAKELSFVLANHILIDRSGQSYSEFLMARSKIVRRFGVWLVPTPILPESPTD